MRLDHIAIAARTLDEGCAWVQARLGVAPGPGGRHALMGTWNRLLGMGDCYLEVIAIDPHAPAPARRRWFGLDDWQGGPALAAIVLADPGLACAGPGHEVLALSRDDLAWDIALAPEGPLHLIDWGTTAPPQMRLPDSGLRLLAASAPRMPETGDPRLTRGPLAARIVTPRGTVSL